MRYKIPKDGEKRQIQKFLFFPVTIGSERRWLEVAVINQTFRHPYNRWFSESFGN